MDNSDGYYTQDQAATVHTSSVYPMRLGRRQHRFRHTGTTTVQ
ncbi:MAG TPA: hypothetical protein VFZ76_01110 [Anaerolineales bacterium]